MKKYLTGIAVSLMLSGCVQNHYKITTLYTSPADNVTITSEIEGKATVGKIAFTYQRVMDFIDKEYLKRSVLRQ